MWTQHSFPNTSGGSSLPGSPERQPPISSAAEATAAETPQRSGVSLHQRYYALLRRSRFLVVAFWTAMLYFLFWAIPWLPGGLSEEDYTRQVTLTLGLGSVCAALGVGALVVREHLRRTREALLAWRTVYDDATGLYNRRYFYDRLSLECERARRQGATFSLILMRLEHGTGPGCGPSAGALRRLAAALARAARSNDLVAQLGGGELAVVVMGASSKMVPQVADRLRSALEGSLVDSGHRLNLRLGAATYGARARHPSTLLREARRSLSAKPSSEEAAHKEEMAA